MGSADILPAGPQPAEAASKDDLWYLAGDYLVAERPEAVVLGRPGPDERALIEREPIRFSLLGRYGAAYFAGITAEIATSVSVYTVGIPGVIHTIGALGGGGAIVGALAIPAVRKRTVERKRRQTTDRVLQGEDALVLPKRSLGVNLPHDVLDSEVRFVPEENATGQLSAGTLLEAGRGQVPGLQAQQDEAAGGVAGVVNPGLLLEESLSIVGPENRVRFLADVHSSLVAMHEGAEGLIGPGLEPGTPDSMRPVLEGPATSLLLGALGTFGTLRAFVGSMLAEQLKHLYADQLKEFPGLVTDARQLTSPTVHNVSWPRIEGFRRQFTENA